jgi:hypothetical protein
MPSTTQCTRAVREATRGHFPFMRSLPKQESRSVGGRRNQGVLRVAGSPLGERCGPDHPRHGPESAMAPPVLTRRGRKVGRRSVFACALALLGAARVLCPRRRLEPRHAPRPRPPRRPTLRCRRRRRHRRAPSRSTRVRHWPGPRRTSSTSPAGSSVCRPSRRASASSTRASPDAEIAARADAACPYSCPESRAERWSDQLDGD